MPTGLTIPAMYRAFPGENPTRLLATLRIVRSLPSGENRFVTRFSYLGKFNSHILVKLHNLYVKLMRDGVICYVNIREFHQNGILCAGTFDTMMFYPYHNLVHVESPYQVGQRAWRVAGYKPIKERLFRVDNFSMFVPEARIDWSPGGRETLIQNIRWVRRTRELGRP